MMEVRLLKAADRQIDRVYAYGELRFGTRAAEELHARIVDHLRLLAAQPYIGVVEPSLKSRRYVYRSLVVHKHFKLVYYVDESRQTVFIADLWDTRREPARLARPLG